MVGSTLPTLALLTDGDLCTERRSPARSGDPLQPKTKETGQGAQGSSSGRAVGWPSPCGYPRTDRRTAPVLTACLNTCSCQRPGSTQHYAKAKQYTLACPSNNLTAIYSQVKTVTTKKGLLFSQPNIDTGLQLSRAFNASLLLCMQANDRSIFFSYGKTVFCIAFNRPEQ